MIAFNLFDNRPEWTEVVLAVAAGFVAAYLIARIVGRILRWIVRGATGSQRLPLPLHHTALEPPLFAARVVIFLLAWTALTLPLLDAVGAPVEPTITGGALRHWLLGSGLRITLVILIAWLVLRIAHSTAERVERQMAESGDGLDVIERTKRAQTLSELVQNLLAVTVSSIALLMVLRELGVDIVPMLTGAGIVGVALGFGAQYLVRDIIAGFFLILENQVRVGDVAAINGTGGTIEAVNLRTILLRDGEGALHVFQNGAINTLANRSKGYGYYIVDVNILYDQDIDRVVELLRQIGEELRSDPKFGPLMLAPIEIWGVDAFLENRITIKARVKTLPLKQYDVGRELRRRIVLTLRQNGVAMQPTAVPLYVTEVRAAEPVPSTGAPGHQA